MLDLLLAATALFPQGPGSSTAPVVINEFAYDDPSSDDLEFVELYNRSGTAVDISNWSLVSRDPSSPAYGGTGIDPTQVVPAGTVLLPGAFYLFGNPNVVTSPTPGVSQVMPVDSLENGSPESIELLDAAGLLVDSVAYELQAGPWGIAPYGPHPREGDGFYGDLATGSGVGMPSSSTARVLDGYDDDDNGRDFVTSVRPTPGATNVQPGLLPYADTFDTGSLGGAVGNWSAGFVAPSYADPTLIAPNNPTAKPPSPQGGLAMATWDPSGGGNTVALVTAPVADVAVDTWAWFEPTMAPFNPAPYSPSVPPVLLDNYNYADGEWWALGVRGSCAPNANPPDVGGYFAAIAPGVGTRYHFVSGIAWCHLRTTSFSRLWLIDFGNGASAANPNDYTILAGPIDVTAAGWQRLRLHVQGDRYAANFGGTPGFDDGQSFTGSVATQGPGAVWIGYREAVLYNTNGLAGCHPPLFDALAVHVPTTDVAFFGTASPTSAGTPAIGTRGFAIPGTSTFALTGSGMVPQGHPGYAFCGLVLGFTPVPGGLPLQGAPATAQLWLVPQVVRLGFADASGGVVFPFAMSANANFLGTPFTGQLVDVDLTLPAAVPVGTSPGMTVTVGN